MNKFILIKADDWQILIHNGKRVIENHNLRPYDIMNYLVGKSVDSYEEVDCEEWYDIFSNTTDEPVYAIANFFCEKMNNES